jgi:hypothetical protein
LNDLNAIYDAAITAEEQKKSDKTIQTHLITTKFSRTSTQPPSLPKQEVGKPKPSSFPNAASQLENKSK